MESLMIEPRSRISPKVAVSVAYVMSLFMSAMDNHIVNVMLPTLSREFHAPLASVQWAVIGYVLALAAFIPASGWIGDRFGTKRVFMFAVTLFTVASALCGLAPSIGALVAARVLQGVGGGMLTPVATAMLFRTYPPRERARMTRILIVPVLMGPVIAQPLGGLLVEKLTWRWAFYLNVPFGIATVVVCVLGMIEHKEPERNRFDWRGFVLAGAGLSCFLYGLGEGAHLGWRSPNFWGFGVAGAMLLALFVRVELRTEHPLVKLRLLNDRIFRATNVSGAFNTAAFSGLLFLAAVFLQEARGASALSSGLTTFMTAIGVIVGSQTVGRLYPSVGPRLMSAVGSFMLGAVLVSFLFVGDSTSLWVIRGVLFLAGFANSANTLAVQTSMFARISSTDTGSGASVVSISRQASTAVGIALFTIIISLVPGSTVDKFHWAFVAAGALSLIGGVVALLMIHDSDAAETLVRRPKGVPPRQHELVLD
jgi:EmrB/QacA subfamily drug resistance transporter